MKHKKIILLMIVVGLVCFGAGFLYGAVQSLEWAMEVAEHFLSIEVDEEEIAKAMLQYKGRINECYNG